jgi:7-hydroxymethyl chlorophyll a reductase
MECTASSCLLALMVLQVKRNWKAARAEQHIPEFAKRIVAEYDKEGKIEERVQMRRP